MWIHPPPVRCICELRSFCLAPGTGRFWACDICFGCVPFAQNEATGTGQHQGPDWKQRWHVSWHVIAAISHHVCTDLLTIPDALDKRSFEKGATGACQKPSQAPVWLGWWGACRGFVVDCYVATRVFPSKIQVLRLVFLGDVCNEGCLGGEAPVILLQWCCSC